MKEKGNFNVENNELNIQNKGTTKRKRKQSKTIKNKKKILNRKNRQKQASKLKNAERYRRNLKEYSNENNPIEPSACFKQSEIKNQIKYS